MAAITTRFGEGGANLVPGLSGGDPTLVGALRDIAGDLAAVGMTLAPVWTTAIVVSTNVAVLATAGYVVSVEATTATSAGPKEQIQSGSPAAGNVDVAYAASGVATLTFNAVDAVTACAVAILPKGADYTILTTAA